MRILWILRTCPYPANDGEKIRIFNLLKNLSHHEITIVFRAMNDSEVQSASVLKQYCHDVNWAYIPRPTSNLTRIKWCLPFLFSRYPIGLSTVYFNEIHRIVRRLCAVNSYDIVQIEHSSQSIYLDYTHFHGKPAKILTMHNIDYIRNERVLRNLPFGASKIFYYLNQKRYKSWELSSLNLYDRVITMSETDKNELLKENESLKIDVVPNGVDADFYEQVAQTKDFNKHALLFVASMDSDANNDAAIYFLNQIYPLVKAKYPDACIYLVGRRPSSQLSAFHNNIDIFVTGEVTDVLPYYCKAAVTVVPLRSGGGTRLKILESMAACLPVVSTSVGCEGLNVEDNIHLLMADDREKFAACIMVLFENEDIRKRLVARAFKLVREQYDWKLIAKIHDTLYENMTNLCHPGLIF